MIKTSLILADARRVLASLPDESFDCIATDPPYKTIGGGNRESGNQRHGRPSGMLASNNGKGGFEHNDIHWSEFLPGFFRVLKTDAHCYVFTNTLNMRDALNCADSAGFKLHNVLGAVKQNVTPNRWYMKNGEYVLFLRKGKAFPINDIASKTFHGWQNPVGAKLHPSEKSVDLMRLYVENSTQPGANVLDPFMGSGSTGVACQQTERHFMGVEIDTDYYMTACRRMKKLPCF